MQAADDDRGLELHFAVRDTGIGIAPEMQERSSRPSSRCDSSTTRQYGGTGLGLAISKQIVELMGGRIWLESMPGGGSMFHFTVSLRRCAARASASHAPAA